MINRLLFTGILLFGGLGFSSAAAQVLRYCTQVVPGTSGTDTVIIGLQSLADTAVPIRAITFSYVFATGCSQYAGYETVFETPGSWGSFLARDSVRSGIAVTYQGINYDARLLYGNADPSFAMPNPVLLPPSGDPPLVVFKAIFQTTCPTNGYLEDEGENPVNQIGSLDNVAIPYVVDQLVCAPVGFVHEQTEPPIRIWPNPAHHGLWLEGPEYGHFSIFSPQGSLLNKNTFAGKTFISLPYPTGIYLLKVESPQGQTHTFKVIH